MSANTDLISVAYAAEPNLRKRIYDAINDTPQHRTLFEDIARYHNDHTRSSFVNGASNGTDEHATKKRRLESAVVDNSSLPERTQQRQVILEARDLSFSLPQRKKLHLSIVAYGSGLRDVNTSFALCGRNPSTSQVEFEYPTAGFAYAMRVPVPEKAQKQYNFCFLPSQDKATTGVNVEAIIWTVNHGPLKSCQVSSDELAQITEGQEDVLEKAFAFVMQQTKVKFVFPTEEEFVSAVPESHRKSEKAYHVKAFRGSKDGFLFFLENGIFFGFKKPLAFFSFDEIDSISYTSVLQRTFNLNISIRSNLDDGPQEIEFSMLDQANFGGIDKYIKAHQLQDASLAEARRAKSLKVNGTKSTTGNSQTDGDDRTELEKAEEEMIDEEDEMEEDYDPDEGGDSDYDSSGSEEGYDPGNKSGRDLVKEELGSEAEDVSDSEADDAAAEDADEDVEEEIEEPPKAAPRPPPSSISARHHGPDLDDDDQL